jgi:SAM-dependent methyltransferase
MTRAAALSPLWLDVIDESARTLLGPHDRKGDALHAEVARLSELYTRDRGALRAQSAALAARLRFFLPRDMPKIEGPLAELHWAGAWPRRANLSVLGLGAGLGTTTLGLATYARRVEGVTELDVLAIERDARSLDVMRALAKRAGHGSLADVSVPIQLEARELDLTGVDPRGFGRRFSFIVMGLFLNETYIDHPDRIERRAVFVARCADLLEDDGALVILEPALRESSRELQALRDHLESGARLSVFAPCTHGAPCPMLLAGERDWCHEELPLALPAPLAQVARGAGLRWEGLSYSYLVVRKQSGRLSDTTRLVGGPIESKGRTEWHGCDARGLTRIARLERYRGAGDPLADAGRGSLVRIPEDADRSGTLRSDKVRLERVR